MSKQGFYVQLHLHTSETSRCGRSPAAEMARACKAAGYDLVAVTDHFFNANIGCEPDLSWPEKVEYLLRGYRAAKAEGDRIGLKVIFGWETFTRGPELLTYGLGEDFLLANPDIADVPYDEYVRRVNAAGGLLIHAHPYRKAPYIPDFKPDPDSVLAYEVYNHQNKSPEYNRRAYEEAVKFGKLMIAGSDAHHVADVGGGAMRFSHPVESVADVLEALRHGDGQIIEVMPPAEMLI